jgi:hypothetical protein
MDDQSPLDILSFGAAINDIPLVKAQHSQPNHVVLQIDTQRLLEFFFENFWPSFPVVLPFHYLQARRLNGNHEMNELLSVLQWIGSIYAPWTPSESYYEAALSVLNSPTLAHTPFNVQALMLFAIAQYHCSLKLQARKKLDIAIAMALKLRMNERDFAQTYGEGDPVLEESWRRTYYILYVVDQYFSIVSNTLFYTLLTVPNAVDLPCDDEYYESGVRQTRT